MLNLKLGYTYVGNIIKRKPVYDLLTGGRIKWNQMGSNNNKVYDEISIEGTKFELPAGKDNIIRYLTDMYPEEKEGIQKYFDLVCQVLKETYFLN